MAGRTVSLGIDIGGTAVKAALLVEDGPAVMRTSSPYDRPALDALQGAITRTVHVVLAEAGIAARDLTGVCISVPGPIDETGIVTAAANLPAIVGIDLADRIAAQLALSDKPAVMTDALAAALGEHAQHPEPSRSLYLSIGTGVGGVVLDDGRPLLITRGTSGHIGHIDVSGGEPDAPIGSGTGRGSLEAYIGYRALREAGVPTESPDWPNHPAAQSAINALARGIRTMLVIYRPDRVILLGGVGIELAPALDRLSALVRDRLSAAAPDVWLIRCGTCDQYAAALGAARSVHLRHG
ncbi:MAG: ROK family protein [Phycisphaerales bacterium]|nr:ROK family protein [Phycisphaerales bacterium]